MKDPVLTHQHGRGGGDQGNAIDTGDEVAYHVHHTQRGRERVTSAAHGQGDEVG